VPLGRTASQQPDRDPVSLEWGSATSELEISTGFGESSGKGFLCSPESRIVPGVDDHDRQRLNDHFALGFRELQLRDIQRSDESDIRMGTFIQCAALIDELALANSFNVEDVGDEPEKWRRFVGEYFPPKYAPLADADKGLRCLLVHKASATDTFVFTHDEPQRHLRTENDRLILDRSKFVAEVVRAFVAFEHDVLHDEDALAEGVLAWLDLHPPAGSSMPSEITQAVEPTPGLSVVPSVSDTSQRDAPIASNDPPVPAAADAEEVAPAPAQARRRAAQPANRASKSRASATSTDPPPPAPAAEVDEVDEVAPAPARARPRAAQPANGASKSTASNTSTDPPPAADADEVAAAPARARQRAAQPARAPSIKTRSRPKKRR
jgi:hypothetical protein